MPILKQFGVPAEGLELKIESRGVAPKGGGEVVLSVPMVPNSLKASLFFIDFIVFYSEVAQQTIGDLFDQLFW